MILAGFLVSLAAILLISQRSLPAALISGAILLGLFTLPFGSLLNNIAGTLTDSSILFLALAMAMIPVLGGTMKDSYQIDSLIDNLRFPKRYLLAFSSSLMGLLPMPGGALLSAPIVQKAGTGVEDILKATINNWFRHLFILVYPLSPALVASAKIVNLDVYTAILYILPGLVLSTALGYIFMLRKIHGKDSHSNRFSPKGLLMPLIIILSAPAIDFTLKKTLGMESFATVIGVVVALTLSISLSRVKLNARAIILKSRPWNFGLIIIGMFLYLNIFQASDAKSMIAAIPLPPLILSVVAGFLLGFFTGRVQLPASIVLPVYLSSAGAVTPAIFAPIYISIFFGYITSPVHPCLVVTAQYFNVTVREMMAKIALPTLTMFVAVMIYSILIMGK